METVRFPGTLAILCRRSNSVSCHVHSSSKFVCSFRKLKALHLALFFDHRSKYTVVTAGTCMSNHAPLSLRSA